MSSPLNPADTTGWGCPGTTACFCGAEMRWGGRFALLCPHGGVGAAFRLMFGWCSAGPPFCLRALLWQGGEGFFLKPPPSLFSSFLSAVPGWRLRQRPVWNIWMAIRKPRELAAKTFLKSPGPWPVRLLLATYAGVFLCLSVVVSAGLLVL